MALLFSETKAKEANLDHYAKNKNESTAKAGKLRNWKKNLRKEIALIDTKIHRQTQLILEMQQNITNVLEQYQNEDYNKSKNDLIALFKVYGVLRTSKALSTVKVFSSTSTNTSSSSSCNDLLRQNELLEKNINKARIALNKLHSKHNSEKAKLIREYKLLSKVSRITAYLIIKSCNLFSKRWMLMCHKNSLNYL